MDICYYLVKYDAPEGNLALKGDLQHTKKKTKICGNYKKYLVFHKGRLFTAQ